VGLNLDGEPPESLFHRTAWRCVAATLLGLGAVGAAGAGPVAPLGTWPALIAAAFLLAFSGALSAVEAALFSLGPEQIESLERRGRHGILSAKALLSFRDETLTTILLADYLANLATVICVLIVGSRLAPGRPLVWAVGGGIVSALLVLVVGEFLPRGLGRCHNVAITLALARPLVGLTVLVAPLRWVVVALCNVILRLPDESALEREVGDEEELKTLITAADLGGPLEEEERELINGVVEFGSRCVGDIMTPRPEICAFSIETPHEEIARRMRRCEFSRVLIYEENLDHIRGVLHIKDVLLNPETDYRKMLRKPLIVPETKGLVDLLREFRRHRVHLAVVCDEYGRTVGVVTMHDLLEEIVGELTDENRRHREKIRRLGPSTWLVPGRTTLPEIREEIGLEWPDEFGRTISGFVANRLGRIPSTGDTVEYGGFRITVEQMALRRVALLRVERIGETGENTQPGEAE